MKKLAPFLTVFCLNQTYADEHNSHEKPSTSLEVMRVQSELPQDAYTELHTRYAGDVVFDGRFERFNGGAFLGRAQLRKDIYQVNDAFSFQITGHFLSNSESEASLLKQAFSEVGAGLGAKYSSSKLHVEASFSPLWYTASGNHLSQERLEIELLAPLSKHVQLEYLAEFNHDAREDIFEQEFWQVGLRSTFKTPLKNTTISGIIGYELPRLIGNLPHHEHHVLPERNEELFTTMSVTYSFGKKEH